MYNDIDAIKERMRLLAANILADDFSSGRGDELAELFMKLDKPLGPLPEPQIGHIYQGWQLIGIILGTTVQNGMATYYATFRTEHETNPAYTRIQYCTWYMGQQPKYVPETHETDKDNPNACFCDASPTGDAHLHNPTIPYNEREWEWIYDQGHYDFFGEESRKLAYQDMLMRAGMLPTSAEELDIRPDPGTYTLSQPDSDMPTKLDITSDNCMQLTQWDTTDESFVTHVWLVSSEGDHMRRVMAGKVKPDKTD